MIADIVIDICRDLEQRFFTPRRIIYAILRDWRIDRAPLMNWKRLQLAGLAASKTLGD